MNTYTLFECIGGADEAMIADAGQYTRRRRLSPARAAAAAGLVLLLAAGSVTLHHVHTHRQLTVPSYSEVTQVLPAMTTSPMTLHSSPTEEIHQYAAVQTGSAASDDPASSTSVASTGDRSADDPGPYYEAANSHSLSPDAQAIFCGSYLDDQSRYVIVLTQDTPENRSLICRELEVSEEDVLFKTGTYTHVYLTKLQALISEAMVNRTLPFVVTSGVYENKNRIVVGVTTRDASEIARVLAIDTIGGAIEIEYAENAVFHELPETTD